MCIQHLLSTYLSVSVLRIQKKIKIKRMAPRNSVFCIHVMVLGAEVAQRRKQYNTWKRHLS